MFLFVQVQSVQNFIFFVLFVVDGYRVSINIFLRLNLLFV